MHSQICNLAGAATKALNKSAAAVVAAAALEQYAKLAQKVKELTCIDINEFFSIIALLAVLCWVGQWIKEICHFVTVTIPTFIANLCKGHFSLCLLNCKSSSESHSDEHKKSSQSESQY